MDRVTCAECKESYDSDTTPFCPRCGSTKVRQEDLLAGARVSAAAADPRRRRVQIGGVILVSLSSLGLFFALIAGIFAPQLMADDIPQVMDGLPGGEVRVQVVDNGTAVEGAAVRFTTPNGSTVAQGETVGGWYNASTPQQAVVYVNVTTDAGSWERRAVVLQGEDLTVRVDVADDPRAASEWLGLGMLMRALRIVLVVFGVAALVMLGAGISALRLRNRSLALTGAVVGLLPILVIFVASQSVGAFLVLALIGVALWFIVSGRRQFQD